MPGSVRVDRIRESELGAVAALYGELGEKGHPESLLLWEFFDDALPATGLVVGAYDGDELIGSQAFIPYLAQLGNRRMLSAKSELTLLSPAYRGQGLFDRMYEVGFDLCREAGIDCIWGFTSALKPFARVGFQVGEQLTLEDTVCRPLRLAMSLAVHKMPARFSTSPTPGEMARTMDAAAGEYRFKLVPTESYFLHRYIRNPRRPHLWLDESNGILFSARGSRATLSTPPLINISEVRDVGVLEDSLRQMRGELGFWWAGFRRITTQPSLGWSSLPGSAFRRVSLENRLVFRWLDGEVEAPRFCVEEGFMEGIT